MGANRSGTATWVLGLVDGSLVGLVGLVFFIPGLIGAAILVALTYAAFRSLPLVSGMLVGAGGVVGGLLLRQVILICNEPDRAACPPGGLVIAAGAAIGVALLGLALSAIAARRNRGEADQ